MTNARISFARTEHQYSYPLDATPRSVFPALTHEGDRFAALNVSRARLVGEIQYLKKQITERRKALAYLKKASLMLDRGACPTDKRSKRSRKRARPYRLGQMGQLIVDVLSRAGRPLTTRQVATALVAAGVYRKSGGPSLIACVRGNLHYWALARRIEKSREGRSVKWFVREIVDQTRPYEAGATAAE